MKKHSHTILPIVTSQGVITRGIFIPFITWDLVALRSLQSSISLHLAIWGCQDWYPSFQIQQEGSLWSLGAWSLVWLSSLLIIILKIPQYIKYQIVICYETLISCSRNKSFRTTFQILWFIFKSSPADNILDLQVMLELKNKNNLASTNCSISCLFAIITWGEKNVS